MFADATYPDLRQFPVGKRVKATGDTTQHRTTSNSGVTGALVVGLANAFFLGGILVPSSAVAGMSGVSGPPISLARVARSGGSSERIDDDLEYDMVTVPRSAVWPTIENQHTITLSLHRPENGLSFQADRVDGLSDHTTISGKFNPVDVSAPLLERVKELGQSALEDGIMLSEKSVSNLFDFIRKYEVSIRPSLSALDTGALRAVWKNADLEQVALHFKSDKTVNFVYFHNYAGRMLREYGQASVGNIATEMTDKGLWRLLKNEG